MNIEGQCSLISMVMEHSARSWLFMMDWIGLLLFGLGAVIFFTYAVPRSYKGGEFNFRLFQGLPEPERLPKEGPTQRIIYRTALIVSIVGLVLHLIGRFSSP